MTIEQSQADNAKLWPLLEAEGTLNDIRADVLAATPESRTALADTLYAQDDEDGHRLNGNKAKFGDTLTPRQIEFVQIFHPDADPAVTDEWMES